MPVRKKKPVEANDGSYAGQVLGAYDALNVAAQLKPPLGWAERELARLAWRIRRKTPPLEGGADAIGAFV